jgi:hypothetical protein
MNRRTRRAEKPGTVISGGCCHDKAAAAVAALLHVGFSIFSIDQAERDITTEEESAHSNCRTPVQSLRHVLFKLTDINRKVKKYVRDFRNFRIEKTNTAVAMKGKAAQLQLFVFGI